MFKTTNLQINKLYNFYVIKNHITFPFLFQPLITYFRNVILTIKLFQGICACTPVLQSYKTINNIIFYKIKIAQLIKLQFCCLIHIFFLMIRRFLFKRFIYQQFVESVKMRKCTTPTGIILLIVHYV